MLRADEINGITIAEFLNEPPVMLDGAIHQDRGAENRRCAVKLSRRPIVSEQDRFGHPRPGDLVFRRHGVPRVLIARRALRKTRVKSAGFTRCCMGSLP